MATFDATKFLNFYGFVPNALDHIRGNANKPPVRKPAGRATQDNRPSNPFERRKGSPTITDLTLKWDAGDTAQGGSLGNDTPLGSEQGSAQPATENVYTFEIPPVITVNLKKNVVNTKIAGSSRPPVVEIIGYDTFSIKIQGYMENVQKHALTEQEDGAWWREPATTSEMALRDQVFPTEKLEKLYEIFSKNEALTAECELLRLFNISRIVITSMPEVTYYPTAFTYSFNAVADAHQEILILND
ncbi:MAG: DUF6046 domain-containing protein [Bacteroidota bacterium]